MDSSIQSLKVSCAIRHIAVADTPEERVRQRLLLHLIHKLRFPKEGIVVERALDQMPHLRMKQSEIPDRRADILCYSRGKPLLLVECKAVALDEGTLDQVIGYNHYVKSPFIVVANETDIRMGWFDGEQKKYVFISYIPEYEQLIRSIEGR